MNKPSRVAGAQAAESAVRVWESMARRLAPIIGERGFRVLYARSVHLTRASFPCLGSPAAQSEATDSTFAALRQSLEREHPALAADANRELLLTFNRLLNSLIGEALTSRLLQSVSPAGGADERSQESRK